MDNKQSTIIDEHVLSRGGGGWNDAFENSSMKIISNKLFSINDIKSNVSIYNTDTKLKLATIPLDDCPITGTNVYFNCIDYYAPSNWLIVGGCAVGVLDLNTGSVIRWMTNYRSNFKINNHKLYMWMNGLTYWSLYHRDMPQIDVLDITNGFQKIGQIDY